jgi:hypothetical protein
MTREIYRIQYGDQDIRYEGGKRTYSITTKRMISGLVLNHLNGLGLVIARGYRTPCPAASQLPLKGPNRGASQPRAKVLAKRVNN